MAGRWRDVTLVKVHLVDWDHMDQHPKGLLLQVFAFKWEGFIYYLIDLRILPELRSWLREQPGRDMHFGDSEFRNSVAERIASRLDFGTDFDHAAAFVCRIALGPKPFCDQAVATIAHGMRESMGLKPHDPRHAFVVTRQVEVCLETGDDFTEVRTRGDGLQRRYFPR